MLKYIFELLIPMICSSAQWLLTWIFVLFLRIALLHELRWKGRGFIYLSRPWSFLDRNLAPCPLTHSHLPRCPSLEVVHARSLPYLHFYLVSRDLWRVVGGFFLVVVVFSGCATWHVESCFPDQGSNPRPLQWKCRVLTTGPSRNSLVGGFF